jgi:hypothetical protein
LANLPLKVSFPTRHDLVDFVSLRWQIRKGQIERKPIPDPAGMPDAPEIRHGAGELANIAQTPTPVVPMHVRRLEKSIAA